MTRLPRRHTNSGNPNMFFDESLRTTKTVVVVRIRWRIVVAVGDAHVLSIIVPGTAAQHAGTSAWDLVGFRRENAGKRHVLE